MSMPMRPTTDAATTSFSTVDTTADTTSDAHAPRSTSRRRAVAAVAAALVAPFASRVAAQPKAAVLQIVGSWEMSGLQPANTGHLFVRMQVTETLVGARDDGSLEGELAVSWTASDDGRSWRFQLRPAARFHDGTPVTAAAVVRCLDTARVPPSVLGQAPISAVETDGTHAVIVRLHAPMAGVPALLAHISTMVLAPSSYDASGQVRSVVGSGPYRVSVLTPPSVIETVAFDGYDGPRPAIAAARYLSASRAETRALMAESGQADLAYGLDPASLLRLQRSRSVTVQTVTLPRTVIVKLNAALPALADVRVRQALSLAVNRAGIARALLRDPTLAAGQLLPPVLAGWHDPTIDPLRTDTAAAARLLDAAGWTVGPDGMRLRDGQPLRLTLTTFPDRPELPLLATALQEQWRQIGVAVRVNVGNSGDIPLGHRDGTLQMGLAARNYASVPDPTGTLTADFSPTGGDWGAMGWSDAATTAALAELARGTTAQRTAALRKQVLRALQQQLPVIPVAWYRQQVAVSRRIDGASLDPLERSYRLTRLRWAS